MRREEGGRRKREEEGGGQERKHVIKLDKRLLQWHISADGL